jgi:hypothetical protein
MREGRGVERREAEGGEVEEEWRGWARGDNKERIFT